MSTVPFYDLGSITRSEAQELHEALDVVLDTGYFVGGPTTEKFESEFADFIGSSDAVGVANGLDAIRLALEALGVGPGDEVIVPAFTYFATWLGVIQTGATPVPIDSLASSANMDPDEIEAAITEKTKAVLPVHLYGQAADLAAIQKVTKSHGLLLLEDAAQSHGAQSTAGMTGAVGHAAAFSFYPTKNLGALGDAGAVTTSDPVIAARVRSRRSYGQGSTKYDHIDTGWNSRLDPLQAAFLSLHLHRLTEWTAERRRIAQTYIEALGTHRAAAVVGPQDVNQSVWHHFVIKASDRNKLQGYLSNEGVSSDAHYPYAVHQLPPMKKLLNVNGRQLSFPVAERLAEEVTSLPMGPWMTAVQIDKVASVLAGTPEELLSI